MWLYFAVYTSSDHLMHVRRWLLDFGCVIAVVNVIVVLLYLDLLNSII